MFAIKKGFEWVPDALLKEASIPQDDNKPVILVPGGPRVRTRKPTDANYRGVMRPIRNRMRKLTDKLASGEIDLAEWEREFTKLVESAHINSARLGRMRAGDLVENVVYDQILGMLSANSDRAYLHGFVNDIQKGRYTDRLGDLKPEPIKSRQLLYANKSRGTANLAFVSSSQHAATFDWVMLNAEHCDVCPEYQKGSPYTGQTLPAFPADGTTPCRANCGCVLVRDDGTIGFSRVFD